MCKISIEMEDPMALKHLSVPIQPDQRWDFDGGEYVKKSLPVTWNLRVGDRLTWYYGDESGITEVVSSSREYDKQICLLRKVC